MRIKIDFEIDNAAFEDNFHWELKYVMRQAAAKIAEQMKRPAAVCDAPESADILLDSNGNRIGEVFVDVDNERCPHFKSGSPNGTCQGNGHYLCNGCAEKEVDGA